MARIRRCAHLHLALEGRRMLAVSPACGREVELDEAELEFLRELPDDDYVDADAPPPRLPELIQSGVVVVEGESGSDDRLREGRWLPLAALYDRVTAWRGVGVELDEVAAAEARGERAPLPPAFHAAPGASEVLELPLVEREGGLYDVLLRRATARVFTRGKPLAAADLAVILRYVWGAHGFYRVAGGGHGLRKTSPSGGALHPVEVYPLLLDCDGVDPGVYHYRADLHALEVLRALDEGAARELSVELTAGQTYFGDAQALFVLTGRFARSFWRYPRHDKAYGALLMDAAHLSQSFYLVCTELGLGPFVTAAINNANVDDLLGLEPLEEGSLAICGCGVPAAEAPRELQPPYRPFVPRQTMLD